MCEDEKAKREKYILAIPIVITIICALLDWWSARATGVYKDFTLVKYIENVLRLLMGYFFPSFISISITMLVQCGIFKEDIIGLDRNKIRTAIVWTGIYIIVFVMCLMDYGIKSASFFTIASFIYVYVFNSNCLDERIRFKELEANKGKYINKPNE